MYPKVGIILSLLSLSAALPSPTFPRDGNRGCSAISFGDFAWTVKSFVYKASYIFTTPAHQNSYGTVKFDCINPALPYKGSCSASSSQLNDFFYGTVPYKCSFPDGKTAEGDFYFDRPSGLLNFTQSWSCSDLDPQYP
jgi:hypothetical protein